MSSRLTRFEIINVGNIVLTLILSGIAVLLSYNAYRVSENTFALSIKLDSLNEVQSEIEIKSAVTELFTTIDMQRQNDAEGKDINKCISTLLEMKNILESQMKNIFLAQNKDLSELWVDLHSRIQFNIKFLELGLKENTHLDGVQNIISEMEEKADKIFKKIIDHHYTKQQPVE